MPEANVDKTQKKLKADQAPDAGANGVAAKTTWDAVTGTQSYADGSSINIDGWA